MSVGKLVLGVGAAFLAAPLIFWAVNESRGPRTSDVVPSEAVSSRAPPARANVRLEGHVSGVGAVAFSGDGRRLVSGSDDGALRVWDVSRGLELAAQREHGAAVRMVALNRDGTRGLSFDADSVTRLWGVDDQRGFTPIAEMRGVALALRFTEDGAAIVATEYPGRLTAIELWDVEKQERLSRWPVRRNATLVAFDASGGRFAALGAQALQIFDAELGTPFPDVTVRARYIRSLAISPDGSSIAYDLGNDTVRVVRVADGTVSASMPHEGEPRRLVFTEGGLVLMARRDAVELWNPSDGSEPVRLDTEGHTSIRSIAASPTERRFATGLADGGVLLWDEEAAVGLVRSGQYGQAMSPEALAAAADAYRDALARASEPLVRPLLAHREAVTSVTVRRDGGLIASGSEDGAIVLWNAESGAPIRELVGHTRAVRGLALSPDGERLVSTSDDGTARLWSVSTGSVLRVLRDSVRYASAAYSPDGSLLATGVSAERATHLWNPVTGVRLGALEHRDGGGGVAFSPDGGSLFMRLSGGVVAWNARTQRALWQVMGQWGGSSVAVDSTGSLLAIDARTHVALVDVRARQLLDTLATPPGAGHLAFTPTGELVMASGRTVRVWDVVTRQEVASLSGAMGEVSALALSGDGTLLAAGSRDGAVWVWNLPAARRASDLGLMPWDVWDGPLPPGVGVHCDRRYGPGGVVVGVVLDSLDAVPVDSAQVSINGCRVDTDAQGNFLFVGIDPGMHQLSAFEPGWRGGSERIESRVDDTTRVTLRIPRKVACTPAQHPGLPRIENEGPVISLRLDDRLQAALDAYAPGFVPYGLDAYAQWIASGYSLQCYQAPSAVLGDFNGDGVIDLAAVGRSGDQGVDLVLISSADGYIAARNERGRAAGGDGYVYYVREEPRLVRCLEEAPVLLTTDAVHEIFDEKASTLHYWRDGEWRECATSD